MEDDAIPVGTPNLPQLFASAPPTADLLYFAGSPVRNRKRVSLSSMCNQENKWILLPPDIQMYGSYAYGIQTKEAAQNLLDFLESTKITYDSALIRWRKNNPGRVAIHCPFTFSHSDGFSDIEGVIRKIH